MAVRCWEESCARIGAENARNDTAATPRAARTCSFIRTDLLAGGELTTSARSCQGGGIPVLGRGQPLDLLGKKQPVFTSPRAPDNAAEAFAQERRRDKARLPSVVCELVGDLPPRVSDRLREQ